MDNNEGERRQKQEQQQVQHAMTTAVLDSFGSTQGLPSASYCQLPQILDHYQNQIRRIDNIERRLDDRIIQARRRICSIIDHAPNTRSSHLRLFLSHSYQPPFIVQDQQSPTVPAALPEVTAIPTDISPSSQPPIPIKKRVLPKPAVWTLNVEGKLLIDHLDHASAAAYDRQTNYVAPNDDLDRSKGNEVTTGEEKDIPSPILFAKYFDKMRVTFQTTFYQPQKVAAQQAAAAAAAAALASGNKKGSPKKKSARGRSNTSTPTPDSIDTVLESGGGSTDPLKVDPRSLYLSPKQTLTWTKDMPILSNTADALNTDNTTTAASTSEKGKSSTLTAKTNDYETNNVVATTTSASELDLTTNDAHVLCVQYQEPQPPPLSAAGSGGLTVYSVIAHIELYRRTHYNTDGVGVASTATSQQQQPAAPIDQYRIISSKLAQAMFPHHDPESTDLLTGRKRKFDDIVDSRDSNNDQSNTTDTNWNCSSGASGDSSPPPDQNEIHVPTTISMKEIGMAFFMYIRDRKLLDEHDKITVICDELLQDLLNREQFLFSELQEVLFEQKLIERIKTIQPVRITYILKKETAYDFGKPFPEDDDNNPNAVDPSLLQFDLDCTVPSLFPYRARELLRRIKRRELEYTSARPKARNLLPASSLSSKSTTSTNPSSSAGGGGSSSNKDATSTVSVTDGGEIIRRKIEEAIEHNTLSEDMIPIYLALGKAAPPFSEARIAAHLDARMAYLLSRCKERCNSALASWKLVDWLISNNDKKKEELS